MSKNKNIIAAKTYLISKEFGDQLPLFKHYLTIPTYQRPYSWKKENILTLMNDYVFDMTKEYFIGNITLINDNEKLPQRLEIVDGQQRIATNYLILIWLKNHFKDVQKFFSFNSKVSEIKLEMSYPDDEILTKICEKDTNRKIFSEFDSYLNRKPNKYVRKQIKIFKNAFVTIQNFLEKRSDLQEIYEFIFNNVFCLEIIDNHDGIVGDLLFLSLNGKGLKLDQIDLIKSFFVRDYMDTSTDLKSFKDKWSNLIINTQNNLKRIFISYQESKGIELKGNNWTLQLKDFYHKNNINQKDEFKNLCEWCETNKKIIDLDTGNAEIDFYLRLFKKFNYVKLNSIVYMFIEMFNRKKKEIAKLLHLLFKVNFLMVTFGNKKASVFISSIITPVKEIKKTNKNVDLYDKVIQFLNDKLDEIYINNNYFKNFNIDAYSYTNNKDVVDLINIYAQNYDESTQTIDFGKISPILLELSTDHLIPKTKPYYFEKIVDILKSGKKKKKTIKHPIYSVQQQNNKKIVSYDQEIFRNCEKTLSLKQGMDKDDFMNKVIHKPFNLRNVSKSHNSRKQNKLAYTKEQLCDIMADSKINERIKKYNDFFHFFIFDKLPLHKSDNKSPIDWWIKVSNSLRKITNYVFVPGDTKYNVNLIDKAIEIKALTVDDQSILHDLRKKRNKIAHEETSDVILTEEEIEKIKCILSKIEKFGK